MWVYTETQKLPQYRQGNYLRWMLSNDAGATDNDTHSESSLSAKAPQSASAPVSLVFHNNNTPRYVPQIEIYHLASEPVGAGTRIRGIIRNGTARRFGTVIIAVVTFDKAGDVTSRGTAFFTDFVAGESRTLETTVNVRLHEIAAHRFDLVSAQ